MILVALSGLLAGAFHVLSGPDHVAAVAPLALSARGRASTEGWRWGVGHTSGVLVVGGLAIVLRGLLPPLETISAWSEQVVGAALIGIGIWSLVRALHIGSRPHAHGVVAHDHTHVQTGPTWLRRLGHPHAAFAMGVLHGAAGTSHLLGIVPALALPTTGASVIYLMAFGVGSVAAMAGFAACVGQLRAIGARKLEGTLMATCGALAIAVGVFWIAGPSTETPRAPAPATALSRP